ncbi:hypothetical protein ACFL49_00835 [Candidatus Omnitrophota bacterium]
MEKKTLIFLFCLTLTFFAFDFSWAREYISEKTVSIVGSNPEAVFSEQGAFSIDVPDGWVVKKDKTLQGKVWFYLSSGSQDERIVEPGISIQPSRRLDLKRGITFGVETPAGVKEEDLLDNAYQEAIAFLKSGPQGVATLISQKKIVLDGVPAYRIDFKLDFRPRGGSLAYVSQIGCFTREYIYNIGIISPDNNGTPVQDKMLGTLKLQH